MRKYIKSFCCRGMMFAWGGPVILAIVWICLKSAGAVSMLTVEEVVLGTVSSTLLAFIAAGISIVYQIEQLPKAFAGMIQCAVLYIDYLGIYLLNGWISWDRVLGFTLIFLLGFVAIWCIIYILIRIKVKRLNRMLSENR